MFGAVLAFTRFELELFFKTFIAVFFTFLAPYGAYASAVMSTRDDPVGAASKVLPLTIGLIIVFVSLFTLAAQVVAYREMGFYKRILVTRINPVGIALSNALRGYAIVAIGLAFILGMSAVFQGILPRFDPIQGLIATVIAGGGMFMVGIIPACFVERSRSMFTIASVLSYILVLFSGALPPFGGWGDWVTLVYPISPSYHMLNVLKAGYSGHLLQMSVLWSVGFLLLAAGASLLVVRRYLSWH